MPSSLRLDSPPSTTETAVTQAYDLVCDGASQQASSTRVAQQLKLRLRVTVDRAASTGAAYRQYMTSLRHGNELVI